jgi:ribosomal protein S18 acetylase RimI-like enzyme
MDGRDLVFRELPVSEFLDLIEKDFIAAFGRSVRSMPPRVLSDPHLAALPIRLVMFLDGALAGWHFGRQIAPGVYQMSNSCVLPAYRRHGLYQKLFTHLCERLRADGFTRIISRHKADNGPILAAKQKQGFVFEAVDEDPVLGPLHRYALKL